MTTNSLISLDLYKVYDTWYFDDEVYDITREPFVLGMSEILSSYLHPEALTCTILASRQAFPMAKKLRLDREEADGGWYTVERSGMQGWLCPVTRIYMGTIPENIYFNILAHTPVS
jgi:hypothetical protein